MAPGWSSSPKLGRLAYTLEGSFCVLSGVARSQHRQWQQVIGYLPSECIPRDGRIVASGLSGDKTVRIDILKGGEIVYVEGPQNTEWVSLAGVSFFVDNAGTALTLFPGYSQFKRGYRIPSWRKQGSICALSGIVENNANGRPIRLARLPEDCRPLLGKLTFGTNHYHSLDVIQITRTGYINYVAGAKTDSWLSLDGISFVVDQAHAVTVLKARHDEKEKEAKLADEAERLVPKIELLGMSSGQRELGAPFQRPRYVRLGSICFPTGTLYVSDVRYPILTLPPNCRPEVRSVFQTTRGKDHAARTDVLPNGDVVWAGGDDYPGAYPLDNIVFPVKGSKLTPFTLTHPWYFAEVGQSRISTAGAGFLREGKLCVLSGVVHSTQEPSVWARRTIIGQLPKACRPKKTISLNANSHQYPVHLQINKRGIIRFIDGARTQKWISLHGISFVVKSVMQPLQLVNGWRKYNRWQRRPAYYKQGDMVVLAGTVYSDRQFGNGVIGVLPVDSRPKASLIFAVNHGLREQATVIIKASGEITYQPGARARGWVHLDGIRFMSTALKPLGVSIVKGQAGGYFSKKNLARLPGAQVFADSEAGGKFTKAHLNDGVYGNRGAWAPAFGSANSFFGVKLSWISAVKSIAFGRSNTEVVRQDHIPTAYTIQFSPGFMGEKDPENEWITVGRVETSNLKELPTRRHVFNFKRPVMAGSIRVVCEQPNCIVDELEVYGRRSIGMTTGGAAGGTFDHSNWARMGGAKAFASSEFPSPVHAIAHVNDGTYGNSNSWISHPNQKGLRFVGISLPTSVHVRSIALGRDNTGHLQDRINGQYVVQYTKAAHPSKDTPDNEWITIGASVKVQDLHQLALRHVWVFDKTVTATGIRVIVTNKDMAIDEIELYPHVVTA